MTTGTESKFISLKAEAAVLGSMMQDSTCIEAVARLIGPDSFSLPEHRLIYQTILDLKESGGGIDGVMVFEALQQNGALDDIGGTDYLYRVIESTPFAANARYYAGIVREKAKLRELARKVEEVGNLIGTDKKFDSIADELKPLCSGIQSIIAEGAPGSQNSDSLQDEIAAVISGKIETVPLLWRQTNHLTHAMQPGTVTLLCGNPGASKSLKLLEQLAAWHDAGYEAAIFCLEESRVFHTRRIMAQRAGLSSLTENEWVRDNPDLAQAAIRQHSAFVESIAQRIWVSDSQPTFKDIADWIDARCRDGFRVIAVDPITAAAYTTRDSWKEDNAFLQRVKQSATRHRISLLFVTHPTKTVALPDLNTLAGSAAYGRFCQTALWLQSHEEKQSTVKTDLGRTVVSHNRTLHLLKVRNGKGQGMKLAFQFDAETLRIKELGAIFKDKADKN